MQQRRQACGRQASLLPRFARLAHAPYAGISNFEPASCSACVKSHTPRHSHLMPEAPAANSARGTETKTTPCYMCACRCGIRVHLRAGEVRYIEGNPEHPINKGVICAKGASGIM